MDVDPAVLNDILKRSQTLLAFFTDHGEITIHQLKHKDKNAHVITTYIRSGSDAKLHSARLAQLNREPTLHEEMEDFGCTNETRYKIFQ